jgi:hypothetical protein
MGTALRKLKKGNPGIGGKKKLTNAMIDKLQNYYGIAIRFDVGNLNKMKKAIHATLFHCASNKDRPLHDHCPDGASSWCGYKRDAANKTKKFKHGCWYYIPYNFILLLIRLSQGKDYKYINERLNTYVIMKHQGINKQRETTKNDQ